MGKVKEFYYDILIAEDTAYEDTGWKFKILVDRPKEFTWKLETPWGVIEIYSGAMVTDPFKESNVAEYIMEQQIDSYRNYVNSLSR